MSMSSNMMSSIVHLKKQLPHCIWVKVGPEIVRKLIVAVGGEGEHLMSDGNGYLLYQFRIHIKN